MRYLLVLIALISLPTKAIELDMYLGLSQGTVEEYTHTSVITGIGINEYLAIEGRLGTGSKNEQSKLDLTASLLAKISVPINETNKINIFGGMSASNILYSPRYDKEYNDAALSSTVGFGIEMKLSESITVSIDKISYIKAEEYNLSGFNLSIIKYF